MNYRFAVENRNYIDYSSGRVFYNQKGTTAFPVRLASEIYQLSKSILINQGFHKPYVVYDPCSGGAYLLTSIGYLHGEEISKIYASDIDETIIPLAQKNLALLTRDGLEDRIKEIQNMIKAFGKESHLEALESALTLKGILEKRDKSIEVKCFVADITKDKSTSSCINNVNIVITDIPYGDIVNWSCVHSEEEAVEKLLDNLCEIISSYSVISIISKSKIKIRHKDFKIIERFIMGKRQITILQPLFRV
jgi:hypothetical protein